MSGLLQFPVTLKLGGFNPDPAPLELMEALQSILITETDDGPSGFQISFHAQRSTGPSTDYPISLHPSLQAFQRVRVLATVNGSAYVLIDGFITHQQLEPSPHGPLFTVTGEDVSVMMDVIELSFQYPSLPDYLIVNAVLAKYTAVGIIPEVMPTAGTLIPNPLQVIPQQNATDRDYVRHLACKNACVFYVKEGPSEGWSYAYWGPPPRYGTPQKVLTADAGPFSNVQSLHFKFDSRAPTFINGMVQDTFFTDADLPVITTFSTLPSLSSSPALESLHTRHSLFQNQGLDYASAWIKAQALTDKSTWRVVEAEGELDAFQYGGILRAHDLVDVRSAGNNFDGTYYVQQVTHQITPGQYTQKFTLLRGGLGSSISTVST